VIVLVDTNVVLDWLRGRQPFADAAARVMSAIAAGRLQGVIAAITVTNAYYIAKIPRGRATAQAFVADLRKLGTIVPFDDSLLGDALSMEIGDLEDALQAASARAAGARYIVTRDAGDFAKSSVPAISPEELLALLGRSDVERTDG
jgi:predicted nucleic acid-binding protein